MDNGLHGSGTLRSLTLSFLANTRGLTQGVQAVRQETQHLGRDVQQTNSMMGGIKTTALGFGTAALGLAGISTTFGAIQNSVISTNAQLETSSLQFETLMGSADKAQDHVQDLFEFAKYTPFETGPIIQASRMLQTFGGDALNTKDNLYLFGDAAAAVSTDFSSLSFWVGRMYSAIQGGQPFGEAAMRLQELAVLSPEVRREMEQLQKSGADASQVWGVFTSDLERFDGAMEKQADTWSGLTSTVSDAFNLMMAEAFRPFFEQAKQGLRDLIALFEDPSFQEGAMQIADALMTIFGHAGQVIGVTLELGLLWAEHVDTLLPLVVIWYGTRLVRSMREATRGSDLLTGSLKSLRGVLLLGLPFIIEWASGVTDFTYALVNGEDALRSYQGASSAFSNKGFLMFGDTNSQIQELTTELYEARYGALGFMESFDGPKWRALRANVEDLLGDLASRFGPIFEELRQDADAWGRDWEDVARQAIRANEDLGYSYEEWRDRVNESLESALNPELLKTQARDMASAVPEELENATLEAEEIAREIPERIGNAILGSVSDLEGIAATIFDILETGLTDAVARAEALAMLASPAITEGFTSGSTEMQDRFLFEVVDPLLKSLALIGPEALIYGEGIPANLQGGIDENKQLAIDAVTALRDQMMPGMDLAEFAKEYGLAGIASYIEGIREKDEEARNTAAWVAGHVRDDLTFDATSGGESVMETWMNGLTSMFWAKNPEVVTAINYMKSQLGGSLPTVGPLAGGAGSGGMSIAQSWMGTMTDTIYSMVPELDAAIATVGSHLTAVAAQDPNSSLHAETAAGGPTIAAAAVDHDGSGGDLHLHLTMNGTVKDGEVDEEELVDILQRMDWSVGRVRSQPRG